MKDKDTTRLSPRERAVVASVATAFAAVFLMLSEVFWRAFQDDWAADHLTIPLRLMAVTLAYSVRFVAMPAWLMLSIVAAWQGGMGRRTALTLWVLHEATRESPGRWDERGRSKAESAQHPHRASPLDPPDWSERPVPGWVAWPILLGMLGLFAAYAAARYLANR